MPNYMVTGRVTEAGRPVERDVIAFASDPAQPGIFGDKLGSARSDYDGNYVIPIGTYGDQTAVVALSESEHPRRHPKAVDYVTPTSLDTYPGMVLADNPDGYWQLQDDALATQAVDDSGNSRHGTYEGAVPGGASLLPGGHGKSAAFADDSTSRVQVPSVVSTDSDFNFSFECWFKTTASTKQMILWTRQDTGIAGRLISIKMNGNGSGYDAGRLMLQRINYAGSNETILSEKTYPEIYDGSPHYLAIIRYGLLVVMALDGRKLPCLTYATDTGVFHTGKDHYIGANELLGATPKFVGDMAQVAWYNSVLPESRMRAHYASAF